MIRFRCIACNSLYECEDRKAGHKLACLKCGQRLQIPGRKKTILARLVPSWPSTPAPKAVTPPPPQSTRAIMPPPPKPVFSSQPAPASPQGQSSVGGVGMSLGIGAIILGGLGLVLFWIPLVGAVLGVAGLLMGLVALIISIRQRGRAIGFAIAGSVVSLVGLAPAALTNLAVLQFVRRMSPNATCPNCHHRFNVSESYRGTRAEMVVEVPCPQCGAKWPPAAIYDKK